jgi:uncharacterized integral membrane protein
LLRKIVAAAVLVPLAIIIVAFAVANRQSVTVSFDPFTEHEPAAAVTLPLFALIILLLIVGVMIGGIASWLRQGKWRGSARRFERELQHVRDKLASFESAAGKPTNVPAAGDPPPQRLQLRPPGW